MVTSATILLRMRTNGYLCTSDENSDTNVRFLDPVFLIDSDASATWGLFSWFLIGQAESPPYFYISGQFDLLILESVHCNVCFVFGAAISWE